ITEHFDATNSIFESFNNLTFISGLAFDNYNNLWVTNSFVAGVLKVRKSDGSWKTFSLRPAIGGGEQIVAEQILCDSRNYKWITFPRSNDLIVFYDNNTIDNESDDKLIAIDMNYASEIASTTISAIAEDVNGRIWLGTEQGVKVISQPGNVFKGTAFPQNILLEQGGYVSVLLQFESITAIAVDGANRKWIGTSKAGVFLMSENGTEELLHFTTDNSPLLSNTIRNIIWIFLAINAYFPIG
ncbi:MAG: two-component regulator propeller domain-containing protein, partial [Bacteroidales bacterium]